MYEIFEKLLKENHLRHSDIAKALGISNGTLTDWKMGRYEPKVDKRQAIADYFGVSLSYLDTGKEDKHETLLYNDPVFTEKVRKLYSLPEDRRESLYRYIDVEYDLFLQQSSQENTQHKIIS